MDKKELQKAQNIIDALFYDDKALTQWQHTLLENVISIAQTKLRQPDVSGRYHAKKSATGSTWSVYDKMRQVTILKTVSPNATYNESVVRDTVDKLNDTFR